LILSAFPRRCNVDATNPDWLRSRVGPERFARYLRLAYGDLARAVGLYRLDVQLRDALRPELECVEFAMRSRYHDTMITMRPGLPVWLVDPSLPVRGILHRMHETDLGALEAGRITPGELVDRVSFSFWRRLSARPLEHQLWVPFLRHAYPFGVTRRRAHGAVEDTVSLRNRAHHYDTLINIPIRKHFDAILWLLECLVPELAHERRRESAVPALVQQLESGG
jgi:hypothetical protein